MCAKEIVSSYFDNNYLYMCVQSTIGTSCPLDQQPLKSKRQFLVHCDVSITLAGLLFNKIIHVSCVLVSTMYAEKLEKYYELQTGQNVKRRACGLLQRTAFCLRRENEENLEVVGVWICGRT